MSVEPDERPEQDGADTEPGKPTIVVGVDGSLESSAAAKWAAVEAGLRQRDIVLAHAYDVPALPTDLGAAPTDLGEVLVAEREASTELLDRTAATMTLATQTHLDELVALGSATELLGQLAADAELIVLGQDRPHLVGKLAFGHTTNAVARNAVRPIVVVPRGWRATLADPRPIAVAVDGRHRSTSTLAFAFEEASLRGLPLLVIHSAPLEKLAFGEQDETLNLEELLAGWRADYPDLNVHTLLLNGSPREVVADAAPDAQLLIVGAPRPKNEKKKGEQKDGKRGRRRGKRKKVAWSRWTRSVARAVLLRAGCPVALVPQGAVKPTT